MYATEFAAVLYVQSVGDVVCDANALLPENGAPVGNELTTQPLFAALNEVHPLAARVGPSSNPPAPVGEMRTVCALNVPASKASAAPSDPAFQFHARFRVRVEAVFRQFM